MKETTPLTMKDIARELGISVATVSRALKDSPRISEERRRLVQQYATGLCVRLHRAVLDDDRIRSLHRSHRPFLGEARDTIH